MDLLLVALLLLAVAAVVAVALGAVRGGMAPADDTLPPVLDGPVAAAADLDRARFTLALRGYRMDQVDAVLDSVRDLLASKDEEIDRLRALVRPDEPAGGQGPVPAGGPEPVPADAPEPVAAPVAPVAPVAAPVAAPREDPPPAPALDASSDVGRHRVTEHQREHQREHRA